MSLTVTVTVSRPGWANDDCDLAFLHGVIDRALQASDEVAVMDGAIVATSTTDSEGRTRGSFFVAKEVVS